MPAGSLIDMNLVREMRTERMRVMTETFFSRTASAAIAVALGAAILYAIASIGPIAVARWF